MCVFISYRRDDTAAFTAHLHYSLEQRLGANKIFRDLDTIQPGQNFETIIDEAIRSASVCLVVIGPSWLDIRGSDGRDDALESRGDYVRTEIELALRAGIESYSAASRRAGRRDVLIKTSSRSRFQG